MDKFEKQLIAALQDLEERYSMLQGYNARTSVKLELVRDLVRALNEQMRKEA